MSAHVHALEVELARALRNGEDAHAFDLIERLRLARKRMVEAPIQQAQA